MEARIAGVDVLNEGSFYMGDKSYINGKLAYLRCSLAEYEAASIDFLASPDEDRADQNSAWAKNLNRMRIAEAKIEDYICSVVKKNLIATIVDAPDEC